jgi:glycosyltransferase involved in cell wall biosynthesis
MTKIVVIVRTRNEERNIANFCEAYQWADQIIVADAESIDNTRYIAGAFKNTDVYPYSEFVERNDVQRTPHGKHWNFLIDIAEEIYDADWIIHDDCDCIPTDNLNRYARHLIECCSRDFIYVTRVYMYKDEGYASKLSRENGVWKQGLWAWRAKQGFRFSEVDPFVHTFVEPEYTNIWKILPPMALLHYPWPDEATIRKKISFYNAVYDRETSHPAEYAGEILPLEWWMKT